MRVPKDVIELEVAFAKPDKQIIVTIQLEKACSVQQAIDESGILQEYPEIDLTKLKVGIFGKVCDLERIVKAGDRVEIYRPLLQNPMDARRNRAVKN